MVTFEEEKTIEQLAAFYQQGRIKGFELSYWSQDHLYLGQLVLSDAEGDYHEILRVERILVLRQMLTLTLNHIAKEFMK